MDLSTEHLDALANVSKAKTFLGREFLTWLWFTSESARGWRTLTHPRRVTKVEFDLWIDDRMVLEAQSRVPALAHQSVMKGGDPSHSREAAAALAVGKIVRELKLGLNIKGVGEFFAVLGSEDLSPRSLKLPMPTNDQGDAQKTAQPLGVRLQHLDLFVVILDHLFATFLSERTSDHWESKTLQDIRDWVQSRQRNEESGRLH